MPLWLIEPIADADDPAWQGRPQWEKVVVRASTPAWARVLARTLDTPDKALEAGDQHPQLGSGFASERLYRVSPLTGGEHPDDGADGIVDQVRRADDA